MYWPVNAPAVYEQRLPTGLASISEDGLHNNQSSTPEEHSSYQGEDAISRERATSAENAYILGLCVSRTGYVLATITSTTITVWQTKPTVVLSSIIRSQRSIQKYGPNVTLTIRPDADLLVVQSSKGYLITYTLTSDGDGRAYELVFTDGGKQARRRSASVYNSNTSSGKSSFLNGGGYVQEASLHFQMVLHLDGGIAKALALDRDLVIVTQNPPAIQCIQWSPDDKGVQTSTELLSDMNWLDVSEGLADCIYDRPMKLFVFISIEGQAYAVQRLVDKNNADRNSSSASFNGHLFHTPELDSDIAVKAAVNPRFSLVALGCANGSVWLYTIRDYSGGISLLRRLAPSSSTSSTGTITSLQYSPDGYCLFAGYERAWITWSVYGQPGGTSFGFERVLQSDDNESWLDGVLDASWIGGGSNIVFATPNSRKLWVVEFARNAIIGCFTPANISRALLQTSQGLVVYQGDQMPDLTTITADAPLWKQVEIPTQYLSEQWPLRAAVISPDRRYIAIAGQLGLAHYSISSSRWRTFTDLSEQNDFIVRGGMCWHHHILIAAVETSSLSHEIRLYSRELPLDNSRALQIVHLSAPVVHLAPSGEDSLLVYTYENILEHYIVAATSSKMQIVKVGQIALHGIIRAPPRVRAVSWVVPEHQLRSGEASQDVSVASIIFLVDGNLVLLQPSTTEEGELKYDMRIIAQHVEYFILARDDHSFNTAVASRARYGDLPSEAVAESFDDTLKDSLWIFDGQDIRVWLDVNEVLDATNSESSREVDASLRIPVDFYPLSAILQKGIVMGAESELVQRRDINFAHFRTVARTTLFLPSVLRHHLGQYDSPTALHVCHQFHHLSYFNHALEILLHNVLDEEVENPSDQDYPLLPTVLSFLSSFPDYLDIVVQCTRKTELRSWRTLFAHLPTPSELFETSLENGLLKTAGGYLLVLHTLSGITSTSPQVIRLLRAAKEAEDWELCKELARFLMALDESGDTLKQALELVESSSPRSSREYSRFPAISNGLGTHDSKSGETATLDVTFEDSNG